MPGSTDSSATYALQPPVAPDGSATTTAANGSANLRNHCLTRALELEGRIDLSRFRTHRFGRAEVQANPPAMFVDTLRVLLDPDRADGTDAEIRFDFDGAEGVAGGSSAGLHVRRWVAVPTDGAGPALAVAMDRATRADLVSDRVTMAEAVEAGRVTLHGDRDRIVELLACFDHPALRT